MIEPSTALEIGPSPQALANAAAQAGAAGRGTALASTPASLPALPDHVAVLLLADVSANWRMWGWSRIVRGSAGLGGVPGLSMAKALGSGHQGGFGLRPSVSRQGLFALFTDEKSADDFIQRSATVQTYRERSGDFLLAKLRATSSRGAWGGATMAVTAVTPITGPVAALTRASIHPGKAMQFWRLSPHSEAALVEAAGCRLAVGLGEAPVLRQATFSVWDSQVAMDAYARSGAHLAAIRSAQAGQWFSESMFVRFALLHLHGRWQGRDHG